MATGMEDDPGRMRLVIAESLRIPVADIKLKSRFREDLGADSLDEIELVMAIEEEFDVEIDDQQAESVKTVGEAMRGVIALLGAKQCQKEK